MHNNITVASVYLYFKVLRDSAEAQEGGLAGQEKTERATPAINSGAPGSASFRLNLRHWIKQPHHLIITACASIDSRWIMERR